MPNSGEWKMWPQSGRIWDGSREFDISTSAATLLLDDTHSGRAFDLTGPEALDHAQAAALISKHVGKHVGYRDVDPGEFRTGLVAAGLPADYADLLVALFAGVRAGLSAKVTDNVRAITGKAPRGFEDYVRDHREAWI